MVAPPSYGKFAHVDAVALRISRLSAAGNPIYVSATGALVFCCEGRIAITPQTEQGATISKGGFCAGKTCNTWDTPDRITGYTGELTLCNVMDEVQEMIGVASALSANVTNGGSAADQIIGSLYYETGSCSDAVVASPVTIEMWSRPVLCKTQVADQSPSALTLWRKKVCPWAYNFVQTAAQDPTGDNFPDYVWSFKLKPQGPLWLSGPFKDNDFLNPDENDLITDAGWTYAEYWSTVTPPTCAAGVAKYITTPAAPA